MGIIDESGKTPTVALREVDENHLERLTYPPTLPTSAGVGITDESGKTPTAALREVGENLERLKTQSEDLMLTIEDEIRYIAKGGKPEVGLPPT